MRSEIYGPMVALGLIFTALCGWLTWQTWVIQSKGSATPQMITVEDLAAHGPGDNLHVRVTGFHTRSEYVVETKNQEWNRVWIPLLGEDRQVKVLIKSFKLKNDGDVTALRQRKEITGIITNDIHALGSSERNKLQQSYPEADFSNILVIEQGKEFPSPMKLYLLLGGTVLLLVLTLGSGLMWVLGSRAQEATVSESGPETIGVEEANLGEHRRTYRPGAMAKRTIFAGFFLLVLFAGIGIFALMHTSADQLWLGIALFVGLELLFVVLIIVGIRRLNARVSLYQQGLLLQRGNTINTCRWEDITMLKGMIRTQYMGGEGYCGGPLILEAREGRRLTIPSQIEEGPALADQVYQEVLPRLLPPARAALQRGERLTFGDVQLDRTGFTRKDGQHLPYNEVADVEVFDAVMIHQTGKKDHWWVGDLEKLPNAALFLELLREFTRE